MHSAVLGGRVQRGHDDLGKHTHQSNDPVAVGGPWCCPLTLLHMPAFQEFGWSMGPTRTKTQVKSKVPELTIQALSPDSAEGGRRPLRRCRENFHELPFLRGALDSWTLLSSAWLSAHVPRCSERLPDPVWASLQWGVSAQWTSLLSTHFLQTVLQWWPACSAPLREGSTWAADAVAPQTGLLLAGDTIHTPLLMKTIRPHRGALT